MYTAPPTDDRDDENRPEKSTESDATERDAPEIERADEGDASDSASAVTDANWTGTVSADD